MRRAGSTALSTAPARRRSSRRELRAAGDPGAGRGQKRYLKSELEHFGVRVPEVRRLARGAARRGGDAAAARALADELWARPVHECRLCAAMVLAARPDLVAPADLPRLRRMVRRGADLGDRRRARGQGAGGAAARPPEAGERLDGWARDRDFWVRRAALLSQIEPLRAGAPFDRFAGYADAMLDEREFFIRKAIGWVLREAGKTRPAEVYAWLAPRAGRASGVTMREAVKYLPPGRREELMTRYAAARRSRAAGSVGGVAAAGARAGLVAGPAAAVPERGVDLGRGEVGAGGGEQLDRVDGGGAQLDLLGGAVDEQLAGFDPGAEAGSRPRMPSRRRTWGTRLSAKAVRRSRSARPTTPARSRSAASSWARLKKGTRSSRPRSLYMETSAKACQEAKSPASAGAEGATESTAAAKLPPCSASRWPPTSRSAAANWAISGWSGSWPRVAATSAP